MYESAAGGKLCRHDGSIHANFRLFVTANTERPGSNQLSAALLNRMIRLWLPAIDSQREDVLAILNQKFAEAGVYGGDELSLLCFEFHVAIKTQQAGESLSIVDGVVLTFRSLIRAVETAIAGLSFLTFSLAHLLTPSVSLFLFSSFSCFLFLLFSLCFACHGLYA